MLFSYFKIAFRSLLRNRTYSLINILGLSAGVAVSLIIFLFVVHESSYDKFHANAGRIFKMAAKVNYGGQRIQLSGMSAGMGPSLKTNHPEVENFVRTYSTSSAVLQSDDQHISNEPNLIFADTSLFSVFDFSLASGSYKALARPGTIVISESLAKKYFGTADVIGKSLLYQQLYTLEVTGVLNPIPSNSTLSFDAVISFSTMSLIPSRKESYAETKPDVGNFPTYILADQPASVPGLASSLQGDKINDVEKEFTFQPLLEQHTPNAYRYLFMATAFVILILALINYMNLTTATATLRSREVGVRKVIGAQRKHLAVQFYLESAVVTILAFVLAFLWIELLLPFFFQALAIRIDLSFLTGPLFLSVAAALLVACVFIAGSYPSLVLSGFKPTEVLKGKSGSSGKAWVRKGFTAFQFAASVCLIMITLGIQAQLEFMRNQKIGLNPDQVMVFSLTTENGSAYAAIKNDIRNLSGVRQVAAASIPLYTRGNDAVFMKTPVTHEDVFMNILNVDENFISTMGIEWVDKPDTIVKSGFIVNEAALEKLKITQNPVGTPLDVGGDHLFPINGIVRDFNYETSHGKAKALIFSVIADTTTAFAKHGVSLYVKLDPKANLRDNVASISTIFRKYQTGKPFDYYFLDDAFDKLFQAEDRLAKIFDVFTGVAMVLACLGLFGLITFSVQVRTKEIGIRKVLGANLATIFGLLSREFLLLIVIGTAFAVPAAVLYINHWLTQFPVRIGMPWWVGVVAAGAAVLLALATISVQIIRAARTNPVDSLRSE